MLALLDKCVYPTLGLCVGGRDGCLRFYVVYVANLPSLFKSNRTTGGLDLGAGVGRERAHDGRGGGADGRQGALTLMLLD